MTLTLSDMQSALARKGAESSDFDLNPDIRLPEGRKLRPAAVLCALIEGERGYDVLLTRRASHLKHHPGQIAFPGGKVDAQDVYPMHAALREAEEEIGLNPSQVKILGEFSGHETVTGFQVTPFLGVVEGTFSPRPEIGEVEEVFRVPLTFLMTPEHYSIERRRWRGQWRSFYIVPYGPYYIWGATARMLKGLCDRVNA